jgi:hypothetical protein
MRYDCYGWDLDLSYTWGEMGEGYALHERGGDISITPNLHSALITLRSQDSFTVLWIDAVCINQQDNREKAAQILLMRRIFQSSARVIAWLGEQYEKSHLVEGLLFKIEDVDLYSVGIEWFSDDDQCWEAFRAFDKTTLVSKGMDYSRDRRCKKLGVQMRRLDGGLDRYLPSNHEDEDSQ